MNLVNDTINANSAIAITQCINVVCLDSVILNNATTITGGNYGVSVANSENVTIERCYIKGLRHAVATGGDDTKGAVPCRRILVRFCTLTNVVSTNQHVADFHGNTLNSEYSDCVIEGTVGIGGKDNSIIRCSLYSENAVTPILYAEVYGGNINIHNNTITLRKTSTVNRVIGTGSAYLSGHKYDIEINVKNNNIIFDYAVRPALVSFIIPSYKSDVSTTNIVVDGNVFTGLSKIDRFINISTVGTVFKKPTYIYIKNMVVNFTFDFFIYGIVTFTTTKFEYPESYGADASMSWFKRKDGYMTTSATQTSNIAIDIADAVHNFSSANIIYTFPIAYTAIPIVQLTTGATARGAIIVSTTATAVTYKVTSAVTQTARNVLVTVNATGKYI